MSAIPLGDLTPNSPEWDEIRSKGIGGSEIAAVVGLSPWVSRFALWHRKRGLLGKQDVNAGMNWGHRLEPVVCDAWAENHPDYSTRRAGTYCHAERRWQLANVDRLLMDVTNPKRPFTEGGDSFLEVKTAHTYDAHEWGYGPEDIPPYYRCQVLWYMDVLGVPEAHMAVLIGGSDYREYVIAYAADEAEWLRNEGEKFWQTVIDNERPDIDGHDATYAAVREMHPEIEKGVEVVLDADLWGEYVDSKDALAAATRRHQAAKSAVLEQMEQAQFAVVGDTTVLRRQPGRGGSVSLYAVPQPKHEAKESA